MFASASTFKVELDEVSGIRAVTSELVHHVAVLEDPPRSWTEIPRDP